MSGRRPSPRSATIWSLMSCSKLLLLPLSCSKLLLLPLSCSKLLLLLFCSKLLPLLFCSRLLLLGPGSKLLLLLLLTSNSKLLLLLMSWSKLPLVIPITWSQVRSRRSRWGPDGRPAAMSARCFLLRGSWLASSGRRPPPLLLPRPDSGVNKKNTSCGVGHEIAWARQTCLSHVGQTEHRTAKVFK